MKSPFTVNRQDLAWGGLAVIIFTFVKTFFENPAIQFLAEYLPENLIDNSPFKFCLSLLASIAIGLVFFSIWVRFFDKLNRCWRAYDKNDFDTIIRLATPIAKNGQVDMQWMLGVTYDNNEYVLHDAKKAVEWLVMASNQGHEFAQCYLATIYDEGRINVASDYDEAIKWFELASSGGLYTKNGSAIAQVCLGLKKLNIDGECRDINGAIDAFDLAAGQGNAQAIGLLAALYFDGDLCPQNYQESLKYFMLLIDQGGSGGWAEAVVGLIHEKGLGVPVNYQEAFKWYKLGVEAGDDDAMNCLAGLYYFGHGITKNEEEAVRLFKLAAELDNQDAISNLEMVRYNSPDEAYRFALKKQQKKMNTKIEKKNLYQGNILHFPPRR